MLPLLGRTIEPDQIRFARADKLLMLLMDVCAVERAEAVAIAAPLPSSAQAPAAVMTEPPPPRIFPPTSPSTLPPTLPVTEPTAPTTLPTLPVTLPPTLPVTEAAVGCRLESSFGDRVPIRLKTLVLSGAVVQ